MAPPLQCDSYLSYINNEQNAEESAAFPKYNRAVRPWHAENGHASYTSQGEYLHQIF